MANTTIDTDLSKDWGGTGESDRRGNTNPYPATSDQLPFSGLQIQKYIKDVLAARAGDAAISGGWLYLFSDTAQKTAWEADNTQPYLKRINMTGASGTSITVSIEGSTVRNYISTAASVTFQYKVNNLIESQYDPNFRVRITVGTNYIDYQPTVTAATDVITSPNLAALLSQIGDDTATVSIYAYVGTRTSTARQVQFTRRTAVVTTSNRINNTDPSVVAFSTQFSSDTAVLTMRVYGASGTVDAGNYTTVTKTLAVGGPAYMDVPSSLSKGAHKIEAYLTILSGTIESSHITTGIMVTTGASTGDCIISCEDIAGAVQGDPYDVKFAVRIAGKQETDTFPVLLQELSSGSYVTKAQRTVTQGGVNTWSYVVPNTSNTIRIFVPQLDSSGETVCDASGSPLMQDALVITFTAQATSVSWQVTSGSLIQLSAQGRLNSDANKSEWKSGSYSVTFADVDFADTGSGWYNQECLRLRGNARASIAGFYPLYDASEYQSGVQGGGLLKLGRTLKMSFKVSEVNDPDQKVISCYDSTGDFGFYVTGDAIYIKCGTKLVSDPRESQAVTGHNARHFSADTKIDLEINIQPYYDEAREETKHEIRYYVNGEIAGFGVISGNTLSQTASGKTLVTFGGNGATLCLYDFRYYEKYLSAFETLQTRTMDLPSSTEIKSTFTKNNFYVLDGAGNPTITLAQALAYGKYLAANGKTNFGVMVSTNMCNGSEYIGNTSEHAVYNESLYIYRFTTDSAGNGIIDPALTIWIEGVSVGALRLRRQGTSTAAATYGNIRADIRKTCRLHAWDATAQKFSTAYTEKGKNAAVFAIPTADAIKCYLLTWKKNPNESTQSRNLPTAKMMEDAARYLAGINTDTSGGTTYGYETCLTPPQRRELAQIATDYPTLTRAQQIARIKKRQCVDGIPSLAFEMVRTTTESIAIDPTTAQTSFAGQGDMITDKTNMDLFGFGDDSSTEDYSVETRQNQSAVCCFHSPDISAAGVKKSDGTDGNDELEYRYPDMDTVGGVTIGLTSSGGIQRLWDFIYNCSTHNIGYQSSAGVVASDGGQITINGATVVDNAANRNAKFKAECGDYLVLQQILLNWIFVNCGLMCDQDVKNQFFTHFKGDATAAGLQQLRLLGYDFDSSWGCDNDNYFRFLYTVMYADGLYDGKHSGRGSDLWELVNANYGTEMALMRKHLYQGGFLTASGVLSYMLTNQIDIYNAMMFNANSEYSYTDNSGDYEKAHGSASEHTEWFVRGRMHFTSGEEFNDYQNGSDFASDFSSFNVTNYDTLSAANKRWNQYDADGNLRYWAIAVQAYERTYAYLRVDTSIQNGGGLVDVAVTYNAAGMPETVTRSTKTLRTNAQIFGGNDTRFYLYGGKHLKTLGDLSHWYVSKINQWGNLVNLEELLLGKYGDVEDADGNTAAYSNSTLNSLNVGTAIFGNCKKLNLAGCSGFAGSLSLAAFPVLEEFEGRRMTGVTEVELPSGSTMKVLRLPANLTSLALTNKTQMTTLTLEGYSSLVSVTTENVSDAANSVILATLKSYYNI